MTRKALELFKELAAQGYIRPATDLGRLEMPTIYRRVPSILTYGVHKSPQLIGTGAHAELGFNPARDRARK